MADQHRVPPDTIRQVLPLIRELAEAEPLSDSGVNWSRGGVMGISALPGAPFDGQRKVSLRLKHFTAEDSKETKAKLGKDADTIATIFEPHIAHAESDETGIVFDIDKETYDRTLKPRFSGELVDDRIYRMLDHCGHRGLTQALKRRALEDAITRFDGGGDTGLGR